MTAVPKPTPRARREPKRLQAKARPIPTSVREATFARDGYLCQWCLQPGGALDPHHRFRRSQGGPDRVEVLVTVHRLCHDYIHDHPAEARRRRFLVRSAEELREHWTDD